LQRAAALYSVSRATLSDQRAGRTPRADFTPKTRKLNEIEEEVIVKHILDLVERGFPPRLAAIADMANSLLAERNLGYVGAN
jgi:hypothetical protein